MFRLAQYWSRFFLNASQIRTYIETLLLFISLFLFTMLAYQSETGEMAISSLTFFIVPSSALYYSFRLRISGGRWYRDIGMDLLGMAVPTLLFNPLVWFLTRTSLFASYANSNDVRVNDLLFIAFMAFPYLFFRGGIRALIWWNDLRQRQMIWSLVSNNLIAVALFQTLIALPLIIILSLFNVDSDFFTEISDIPLAQFLYRLQAALPLIGLALLIVTAILIALLPVSIVVSFYFARRIRERLNVLLEGAHAARDGNYDMPISVTGHDEIAQLQADFNVMTANLKIKMNELHNEREKVAVLLKSRRELIANVSHELRTPIATIRAYIENAPHQHNTGDGALSQNDLSIIQRETLHLQTLIDDLFALSRAEVDQLAIQSMPVDAIFLIQRIVETVAPLAWQLFRIELLAQFPDCLANILADESRLEQVLRNLIHNSLKHTPPGGLIIIRVYQREGYGEIQVQDTGEGIHPEHLPHIWERYYHDAQNDGTGLGLTLVKSFIEAMHGQVEVTSIANEGACFTIKLPMIIDERTLALATPLHVLPSSSANHPVTPH